MKAEIPFLGNLWRASSWVILPNTNPSFGLDFAMDRIFRLRLADSSLDIINIHKL